jgi:hypothetical protein
VITNLVTGFHRDNPLCGGYRQRRAAERADASVETFVAAMEMLVREKKWKSMGKSFA